MRISSNSPYTPLKPIPLSLSLSSLSFPSSFFAAHHNSRRPLVYLVARQLFPSKCFGASAYVNFNRYASATSSFISASVQWCVGRFCTISISP